MKFRSPIVFHLSGVTLRYGSFNIHVPWVSFIPNSGVEIFRYPTIVEYEENSTYKKSSKLEGLDLPSFVEDWVSLKYPSGNLIVLTNVNVKAKNIQFWAKVPKQDIQSFMKDVVILHCKDRSEVIRLVENMPSDFADALGFSAGELITDNKELP